MKAKAFEEFVILDTGEVLFQTWDFVVGDKVGSMRVTKTSRQIKWDEDHGPYFEIELI